MECYMPGGWFAALAPLLQIPDGLAFCGSISQADRIRDPKRTVLYNWDVYPWQDFNAGEWKRWGELLYASPLIIHASQAVVRRTAELYGIRGGVVVKTFCPLDVVKSYAGPISDGGYVVCPVRHYTQDKCFRWGEMACKRIGVRFVHPDHSLALPDYLATLAGCRLILSHYGDASTGGLGMIEAQWFGKPVLANGGPYNGAREHMGGMAEYFVGDSLPALDYALARMMESDADPAVGLAARRAWAEDYQWTAARMAAEINAHLAAL